MHSNPNLVPTVITDVNGKITTVHKKPQNAASTALALSTPVPQNTKSKADTAMSVALLHCAINGTLDNEDEISEMSDYLYEAFPHESLNLYEQVLQRKDKVADGVVYQINCDEVDTIIRSCVHFYPKLGINDYDRVAKLTKSLNWYDAFPDAGVSSFADNEDEALQQKAIAIMTATHLITETSPLDEEDPEHPIAYSEHAYMTNDWRLAHIKDEKLINLLLERPQDAQAIARVVVDRRTTDPDIILGTIHGVIPALAEGAL